MKHLFFSLFVGTALMLSSCQDEDFGYTAEQIRYETAWKKELGTIDPLHDFNLATRTGIYVVPSVSSHIRVFVKDGATWSIVADYADVTSPRIIEFDVACGSSEFMVTDGIQAVTVPVGGVANLSGTRAGNYDDVGPDYDIRLNDGSRYSYLYYDKTAIQEISERLPEDRRNRGMTIQDFTMVSNGPFVVYPFYWYCQAIDQVGVYWRDDDGQIQEHYLFGNHIYNESVQKLDPQGNWTSDLASGDWGTISSNADGPYSIGSAMFSRGNPSQYRSKGVVVDIPVGREFGFFVAPGPHYSHNVPYNWQYLRANYPELLPKGIGDLVHFYSDASLNPLETVGTPDGVYADTLTYCFATYFDKRGDLVVACEDAMGGIRFSSTNFFCLFDKQNRVYDFNDVSFKIYGATPTVLSQEPGEWILPFEDLGSTFDLDFNDVILKMSYVAGADKAYITPLAAGGTLHSEVFFNDTDDESMAVDLGEIHCLLGARQLPDTALYEPINAHSRGKEGKQITVQVRDPEHFSISNAFSTATGSSGPVSTKGVVGVYIKTSGTTGSSTIAYNGMGKIPAMLVIPSNYEHERKWWTWAWPTENTDIRTSYGVPGHSFAEWASDHTKATDWYKYPSGVTVEEKYVDQFVNLYIPTPEYQLTDFGSVVPLPGRDDNGWYSFDALVLDGYGNVTITLLLSGVVDNAVYPYDGSQLGEKVGQWSRHNYNGSITIIGNNSCGDGAGSASYEAIYQIELSASEVDTIRTSGRWVVSAGEGSSILGIVIRGEAAETVEVEPVGISEASANEDTPTLAPKR